MVNSRRAPMQKLKNKMALVLAGIASFTLVFAMPAAAATTVVVSPDNMQGWEFNSDRSTWTSGTGELVEGPEPAPAGTGSARLTTPNTDDRTKLRKYVDAGIQISDITRLEYSTYRAEPTGGVLALALQLDVNFDGTPTSTERADARIVYEPYFTQTIEDDTWQTWNALNDTAGTGTGNWWIAGAESVCPQDNPCTWTELNNAYPDLQTSGESLENSIDTQAAVLFKAGGTWAGFDGNVDNFIFGISGNDTTYNYEATNTPVDYPENKEDCKDGGWENGLADGTDFKNQGDCVSHFASKEKARGNPVMNFFRSLFR